MRFHPSRKIDRIAMPITRACNRRCPECVAVERPSIYGKGPRDPHVSIDELRWVGKTLGPIGKVEITGGEPSMHPDFPWISEHIHELFQCNDIMLLTNGWRFKDDDALPLLLHYDWVYCTHYTPEFAVRYGVTANTDLNGRIRDFLAKHNRRFWSQEMNEHKPQVVPNFDGVNCFYYTCDSVGYSRGQIYGCCTASALDYRGRGIVLTKDWRDHLNEIDLPCDRCFLNNA